MSKKKNRRKSKSSQAFEKGFKDEFLKKPRAYAQKQLDKGKAMREKGIQKSEEAGRNFGKGKVGDGIATGFQAAHDLVAGSVVKGWGKVLKGVFNDPEWYAYNGWMISPAINTSRPFDPVSIKSISGTYPYSPLNGVCHVVQQNLQFNDMRQEEAFQLATLEAFREIRLDMKSNLTYKQQEYDDYVAWVISIVAKACIIERTLALQHKTRPDIPEFQDAVSCVTTNVHENGRLGATKIKMLLEGEISKSHNEYLKLQSMIDKLRIPSKLYQYIQWWLGGIFVDQNAPNPQVYLNMLRDCPIYGVDSNNHIIVQGKWDIATSSVAEVVSELQDLLQAFGLINADIAKTNRYATPTLESWETHAIPTYVDYEFFSVLVNSYMQSSSELETRINPEYLRVDFLEQLTPANTVGVCNALAKWADVVVPFQIVSQAAYFTSDVTLRSTMNVSANVTLSDSSTVVTMYGLHPEDFFLQYSTQLMQQVRITSTTTSSTVSALFTPDNKYSGDLSFTPTAMSAVTPKVVTKYIGFRARAEGYGHVIGKYQHADTHKYIILGVDGNLKARFYYGGTSEQISASTGSVLVSDATVTQGVDSQGRATWVVSVSNGSSTEIPSDARAHFLALFTIRSNIYSDFLNGLICSAVINNPSDISYSTVDPFTVAEFCNLVDYHIPLYVRQIITVKNASDDKELKLMGGFHLLKDTYIPTVVNKSDIQAVLYWMYLGLFSLKPDEKSRAQGVRDNK